MLELMLFSFRFDVFVFPGWQENVNSDKRCLVFARTKVRKDFTITEKASRSRAPTFSWLKAPTSAFTIKTLC